MTTDLTGLVFIITSLRRQNWKGIEIDEVEISGFGSNGISIGAWNGKTVLGTSGSLVL